MLKRTIIALNRKFTRSQSMKGIAMKYLLYLLLALSLIISLLQAQETPKGFRGEFLTQLAEVQEKVVSLADAFPQGKYIWRPIEGVRSVSEVLMHLAGANYLLPSLVGVKSPEGLSQDMEKTVTDKAKVVEVLKQSFGHIRKAITELKDADLEKPAMFFGQETTVRGVYFNAALHMHEHLGQAIAYARMNTIVPPWTAKEQEEAAKKKEEKK